MSKEMATLRMLVAAGEGSSKTNGVTNGESKVGSENKSAQSNYN